MSIAINESSLGHLIRFSRLVVPIRLWVGTLLNEDQSQARYLQESLLSLVTGDKGIQRRPHSIINEMVCNCNRVGEEFANQFVSRGNALQSRQRTGKIGL